MEHDSFVPAPADRVMAALRTPGAVTASLPGWQQDEDAGTEPRGRLRLRVGGSTITYRATVTVTGTGPVFAVQAEGTEVRGSGAAMVTAELEVTATEEPQPGTTLHWRGRADVTGRLASYEDAVVGAAVRRLLDRFCADLAAYPVQESAAEEARAQTGGPGAVPAQESWPKERPEEKGRGEKAPDEKKGPDEKGPDRQAPDQEAADHEATDRAGATPESGDGGDEEPGAREAAQGETAAERDAAEREAAEGEPAEGDEESDVVDDLGEPSGEELEEFELVEVEVEVPESAAALDDLVPPAEAAHARRTMIGRSAEEVDHAPPRGRYAPVPAPEPGAGAATLRWAAPAAAALLASAVVVGRVLRRRR
ncbi:SRPBCC domain-containing protein [Actinacidiphila acididurans]|uniref:SRPBCC family protein n=1 Tax=Actinacidiphila acididurans TaxID=2784346 RepID=A0ABS2TTD5_9ACTN|nr:SRPBCC domain-containing protein [Actinacidiphila acididurans]MBM9505766.1 SRPBCC family protein [Actinacidiphila acididurans]